jgi:hypothetical protein
MQDFQLEKTRVRSARRERVRGCDGEVGVVVERSAVTIIFEVEPRQ